MNIKKFKSKVDLEQELGAQIIQILTQSIHEKGSASLLFSGGGTPKLLMNHLASLDFDWSNVRVGLVDDRMVEASSKFSNLAMLEREFIHQIKQERKPSVHPLVFSPFDLNKNLTKALKSMEELGDLDVVLLGMGGDGHFASLFPNDESSSIGLGDYHSFPLVYTNAPAPPIQRISLTWPCINRAQQIFLHITGQPKLDLLQSKDTRDFLPIDKVFEMPNTPVEVYWAL